MKNLAGWAFMIGSLLLLSFRSPVYEIDGLVGAFRSGNVDQIAPYLDFRVDISLPEKSDTYSKSQAEMIIRDFFENNGVQNFQVKQKGERGGDQYFFGILQTKNGNFQTGLFMKQKGDRQLIQEIRFQIIP